MLYPYSRSEECSWQPEEASRKLDALGGSGGGSYDSYYTRRNHSQTNPNDPRTIPPQNQSTLLTRGRNTADILALRRAFGVNALHGDAIDEPNETTNLKSRCLVGWKVLAPVVKAFCDQLKEPLIIMLLASASISLFLVSRTKVSQSRFHQTTKSCLS